MNWTKQGQEYVSDNYRYSIVNVQRSVDPKKKWTLFDLKEHTEKGKAREYYAASLKDAKEMAESIEKKRPTDGITHQETIGVIQKVPSVILGSKIETYLTANAVIINGEVVMIEGWVRFADDEHDMMQYLVYAEDLAEETDINIPSPQNLDEFRLFVINRVIGDDDTVAHIRHLLEHIKKGEI